MSTEGPRREDQKKAKARVVNFSRPLAYNSRRDGPRPSTVERLPTPSHAASGSSMQSSANKPEKVSPTPNPPKRSATEPFTSGSKAPPMTGDSNFSARTQKDNVRPHARSTEDNARKPVRKSQIDPLPREGAFSLQGAVRSQNLAAKEKGPGQSNSSTRQQSITRKPDGISTREWCAYQLRETYAVIAELEHGGQSNAKFIRSAASLSAAGLALQTPSEEQSTSKKGKEKASIDPESLRASSSNDSEPSTQVDLNPRRALPAQEVTKAIVEKQSEEEDAQFTSTRGNKGEQKGSKSDHAGVSTAARGGKPVNIPSRQRAPNRKAAHGR